MTELNSQSESPKAPPRFSQEQYDMLKRFSDKKDMTEWNNWREKHIEEEISLEGANLDHCYLEEAMLGGAHLEGAGFYDAHLERATLWCTHLEGTFLRGAHLEGADFYDAHLEGADLYAAHLEGARPRDAHLEGANLSGAHLEGANFSEAHLERAKLRGAHLERANFSEAHLEGAILSESHLEGGKFTASVLDGLTLFWGCSVDRKTDFRGVGLDSCRLDEGTKYLLQYNIRRMNWEEWYKQHKTLKWLARLFWWVSDYGISAPRIIKVFFALAAVFAVIYYLWGLISPPGIVDYLFVDANGVKVGWGLAFLRAIHFSVVIMTVGFTNMHANAHSFWAHIFVSLQMVLGFVLLGALVTRFAVLFTAGGPAGKFAQENERKD